MFVNLYLFAVCKFILICFADMYTLRSINRNQEKNLKLVLTQHFIFSGILFLFFLFTFINYLSDIVSGTRWRHSWPHPGPLVTACSLSAGRSCCFVSSSAGLSAVSPVSLVRHSPCHLPWFLFTLITCRSTRFFFPTKGS